MKDVNLMPNFDIILDRITQGICPICTKAIELEYQIIEDEKYGKVRICRNHHVDDFSVYNLGVKEDENNRD
jgi:hypothetical protein